MRIQLVQQLLDRQLVDCTGRPIGKVDDVEFLVGADGSAYVYALLSGPGALGARVGGRVGRLVLAAERFVTGLPMAPMRIPFALVERVDSAVWLRVPAKNLPGSAMEEWLRRQLIARIPGAGRASG